MTDFEKLKREALSRNWTCEPGSGDHVKFRPPGNPKCFVAVAISVNATARAYKNSLMEFRKFDKDFLRPEHVRKKKTETVLPEPPDDNTPIITTEQTPKHMKPQDRTIYKQYAWLQTGIKVRLKDKPDQEDPGVVSEIHSPDNKRVWDTTDIIVFSVKGKKYECMAGELDAWELRKCLKCGKMIPVNHFLTSSKSATKQFTCVECMEEEAKPKPKTVAIILKEMQNVPDNDTKTKNRLTDEMLTLLCTTEKGKLADLSSEQMKRILWNSLKDDDYKDLIREIVNTNTSYALDMIDKCKIAEYILRSRNDNQEFLTYLQNIVTTATKYVSSYDPMIQHQFLSPISNDVLLETVKIRKLEIPQKPLTDEELEKEIVKRGLGRNSTTDDLTDKQLYDALKSRGWNIGKLERTVIQTLE